MLPSAWCVQRTYSQDLTLEVATPWNLCRVPRTLTLDGEDGSKGFCTEIPEAQLMNNEDLYPQVPSLALPALNEEFPEQPDLHAGGMPLSANTISKVVAQLSMAGQPYSGAQEHGGADQSAQHKTTAAGPPRIPPLSLPHVAELTKEERARLPMVTPKQDTQSSIQGAASPETTGSVSAISPSEAVRMLPPGVTFEEFSAKEFAGMTFEQFSGMTFEELLGLTSGRSDISADGGGLVPSEALAATAKCRDQRGAAAAPPLGNHDPLEVASESQYEEEDTAEIERELTVDAVPWGSNAETSNLVSQMLREAAFSREHKSANGTDMEPDGSLHDQLPASLARLPEKCPAEAEQQVTAAVDGPSAATGSCFAFLAHICGGSKSSCALPAALGGSKPRQLPAASSASAQVADGEILL